jgi:hypothetical protein
MTAKIASNPEFITGDSRVWSTSIDKRRTSVSPFMAAIRKNASGAFGDALKDD